MDLEGKILEDNLKNLRKQGDIGGFLQKGRRRKSKNDNNIRNFICGCGKDYLSYPALYTHIKNKHNGIAPKGTTLEAQNKATTNKSRLRSMNDFSQISNGDTNQMMEEEQKEKQKTFKELEEKKNLKLISQAKENIVFKTEEIKIEDFLLLNYLDNKGRCNYEYSFKGIWDEEIKQVRIHPILTAMKKIEFNSKIALTNCNLIFGKFLLELSKISQIDFYGMCSTILRALHKCLDLYGYVLLTKLEQFNKNIRINFKGNPEESEFTNIENCEFISIVYDFFCKVFLKSYFGTKDFEFDFVIKFLSFFNSWLVKYNLAKIRVGFNSF